MAASKVVGTLRVPTTLKEPIMADPFAAKRHQMREEFFAKLFLLGGWLGGTDTYKRTMWAAVPDIAVEPRRLLAHDAQGPARAGREQPAHHGRPRGHAGPVVPSAAETQRHRAVAAVVRRALRDEGVSRSSCGTRFSRSNPGDDITLPRGHLGLSRRADLPAGVPCLFFEGMGGLISYLEPAMCRYFAPIIQATKARLMKLATPRDAEFGLRGAPIEVCNLILLLRPLRRRAGGEHSSPPTTPPSSCIPSCSAPSAPSATR